MLFLDEIQECPNARTALKFLATDDRCDVIASGSLLGIKFNRSANAAVRQIREKGYAVQYKGDKRPVTLVGVNFRTAKRNIDEPVFAQMRG